jgi:heme/copper-type cytochrome/quinol oxidase subunit 2
MLIPPPKGKLDLTFSFVWVIILSNAITVAVCFLFLNPLAKVTQVRGAIIIPLILVLIYLGAFAEKNAFQDMLVVLFFGVLGWIMEKLEWPRPPVLLGLVLGPLAENRLFLSSDNYGLAWTARPGVLIIFVVILFGIFYSAWQTRKARLTSDAKEPAREASAGRIRFGANTLFTVVVVVLLALALWQSRNFGIRAGLFPWVIGIPTLLLACTQILKEIGGRQKSEAKEGAEVEPKIARQRTIAIISWIIGTFLLIWLLGFSWAVPLLILLYLKLAGRERWPLTLTVTICSWLFFYALFEKTLNVPFPDPLLFTLFGTQP